MTTTDMTSEALADSLAAYGDEPLPTDPNVRADYLITNDETAAKMMRRLRGITARRNRIAAFVQAEVDRIEAWAAEMDGPLRDDADTITGWLQEYALHVRSRTDGKVKRLDTPFGTVATKVTAGGWEKADPDALLEWAKAHAVRLVDFTAAFNLSRAKGDLKAEDDGSIVDPLTGEVVPGLKAKPARVTATVSLIAADGAS